MLGLVGALTVVLAGVGYWLLRDGYFALPHALPVALALGISGAVAVGCVARDRGAAAVAAMAAGFVVFNYVFVTRILPDIERRKPAPVFARAFNEAHAPGARFAHFNMSLPSLVYYIDQPVDGLGSPSQVEAYFRDASEERWLLLTDSDWSILQAHAARPDSRIATLCEKARHPLLEATFDQVLRRAPPRDVVLVTNNCR